MRRCVRNVSGEKLVPVNGDPCWPSRGEINQQGNAWEVEDAPRVDFRFRFNERS